MPKLREDPFLNTHEIRNLILKSKRPFFVYNLEKIKEKFFSLKDSLPKKFEIYYSMKANSNMNIVKFLYELGCGIEIASLGELKTAMKVGVSPSKVVFAGPGKDDKEIFQALKSGIKSVNVESSNELLRVNKIAKKLNRVQNVSIRVNPSFEIMESALQMGGDSQKFGIDLEKIKKLEKILLKLKHVNLTGVHVFAATQIFTKSLVIKNFENTVKTAEIVKKTLKRNLKIVDVGIGLGIPYGENEREIELKGLKNALQNVVDGSEIGDSTTFLIETGRFLVAESGYYVTKVLDKKVSRSKTFVICNGGINHLLRPALIGTAHPIEVITKKKLKKFETVSIGGPLCTSLDFFVKDVRLPTLEIGDYVVVKNSGAYGYAESMPYFLSHDFADEYVCLNGEIKLVRRGRNIDDILSEQILVL